MLANMQHLRDRGVFLQHSYIFVTLLLDTFLHVMLDMERMGLPQGKVTRGEPRRKQVSALTGRAQFQDLSRAGVIIIKYRQGDKSGLRPVQKIQSETAKTGQDRGLPTSPLRQRLRPKLTWSSRPMGPQAQVGAGQYS